VPADMHRLRSKPATVRRSCAPRAPSVARTADRLACHNRAAPPAGRRIGQLPHRGPTHRSTSDRAQRRLQNRCQWMAGGLHRARVSGTPRASARDAQRCSVQSHGPTFWARAGIGDDDTEGTAPQRDHWRRQPLILGAVPVRQATNRRRGVDGECGYNRRGSQPAGRPGPGLRRQQRQ